MAHHLTLEEVVGVSPEVHAMALGELRYDELALLLAALAHKLARDAIADGDRGRPQLALALSRAAQATQAAHESIAKAWEVSAPYMKEGRSW